MTLMPFLLGALAMGSLVIAALFLRSWQLSRDRLFLFFAAAFVFFALNWIGLVVDGNQEAGYKVFLPRLAGFALIIVAILDKNRRPR